GVAFARQADARAVIDPGGDLELQLAVFAHLAVAVTAGAGLGDHLAMAAATRAGALDLEEAVGRADASGALAGGAGDRLGAGLGARALAGFAGRGRRHRDLDVGALVGLFEGDLEV